MSIRDKIREVLVGELGKVSLIECTNSLTWIFECEIEKTRETSLEEGRAEGRIDAQDEDDFRVGRVQGYEEAIKALKDQAATYLPIAEALQLLTGTSQPTASKITTLEFMVGVLERRLEDIRG